MGIADNFRTRIMSLHYKLFFLLLLLVVNTPRIEAQIIFRLEEAELSVAFNIATLTLIKPAEKEVNVQMGKLNTELNKKVRYINNMEFFKIYFGIGYTIERIELKLDTLNKINNNVHRFFNRQQKNKNLKYDIYTKYLKSIEKDGLGSVFSNNGNLLKTSLEIMAELEEVEKDLDDTLVNLGLLERLSKFLKK
jgi:hypothetical protein